MRDTVAGLVDSRAPRPGPASVRKRWSEGHVAVRKTSRSTGERLVARLLATASSGRWHSPLTPLRLMLSEWTSNPGRSCSGPPWSADAADPCGPPWLAGGIRSALPALLNLLLHLVCRKNRPLLFLSGAFDRLRDSQRRGEGIVPRTLVSEFPIFGRGYPSVPIALRLHKAVIAPRIRVCWASRREPPSVSVGRGWRLGFVSLERVSSPP